MPTTRPIAASLTPRQAQLLAEIKRYMKDNGMSPRIADLAEKMGASKVTIFEHLGELERKGHIRRNKHQSRGIELVGCKCPVCGSELA